jgi:cyclic pyranopterin phosphate synthase
MSNSLKQDEPGKVRMSDISDKPVSSRTAVASAKVFLNAETLDALRKGNVSKGDVLTIAKIAGVMATKRTSDLIPLCHPIKISKVDLRLEICDYGIYLESEVKADEKTGVEMEALTAVTIAVLTIYDMCKPLQKDIEIGEIRLELKTGGKSGDFHRYKEPKS